MAKRKKYDYARVIMDHEDSYEFLQYLDHHRDISFIRCLRAFVAHKKYSYQCERYEYKHFVDKKGNLVKF